MEAIYGRENMKRKVSFEQAKAQYVHRFTADFVPNWARQQRDDGTYYAPQFASDREWYENTRFHGEEGHIGKRNECYTTGQTWPLGKALTAPYRR